MISKEQSYGLIVVLMLLLSACSNCEDVFVGEIGIKESSFQVLNYFGQTYEVYIDSSYKATKSFYFDPSPSFYSVDLGNTGEKRWRAEKTLPYKYYCKNYVHVDYYQDNISMENSQNQISVDKFLTKAGGNDFNSIEASDDFILIQIAAMVEIKELPEMTPSCLYSYYYLYNSSYSFIRSFPFALGNDFEFMAEDYQIEYQLHACIGLPTINVSNVVEMKLKDNYELSCADSYIIDQGNEPLYATSVYYKMDYGIVRIVLSDDSIIDFVNTGFTEDC